MPDQRTQRTESIRIAVLVPSISPTTGIGRIARSLANRWAELGHEVHCYVQDTDIPDAMVFTLHRLPAPFPFESLNRLMFGPSVRRSLTSLQPDIIESFMVGPSPTNLSAGGNRPVPIVNAQSCHAAGVQFARTSDDETRLEQGLGVFNRVGKVLEHRWVADPATRRIAACSHLVKSQLLEHYPVDPQKIEVIYNGVDLALFDRLASSGCRQRVRAELGIAEGQFLLLFVGNEFGRKGLRTVLQALSMLKRDPLVLAVAGKGDFAPFRRLVASLGIEDKVKVIGIHRQPEQLFTAADTFVFPTLYEPFGLVVAEALAAGIPVVTSGSERCGAVESLRHEIHGLFLEDPQSATEVAASIERVLTDNALRARLRREGHRAALKFDWTSIADQHLDLFRKVLSSQ